MATNQTTGLRLPPDVRRWLRTTAADQDTTLTDLVTRIVRNEMQRPTRVHFEGMAQHG